MKNYTKKEFTYFLQPVPCGNKKQTQTVRQWLDGFSILDEEEFTMLWQLKVMEISQILIGIYEKHVFNHNAINSMLFLNLYILYDLERDFMPQFMENCDESLRILKRIADDTT